MAGKRFPKRIEQMIKTGWSKGENSRTIADRINSSKTAKKLKVEYKPQQIAGKLAHYTLYA